MPSTPPGTLQVAMQLSSSGDGDDDGMANTEDVSGTVLKHVRCMTHPTTPSGSLLPNAGSSAVLIM